MADRRLKIYETYFTDSEKMELEELDSRENKIYLEIKEDIHYLEELDEHYRASLVILKGMAITDGLDINILVYNSSVTHLVTEINKFTNLKSLLYSYIHALDNEVEALILIVRNIYESLSRMSNGDSD